MVNPYEGFHIALWHARNYRVEGYYRWRQHAAWCLDLAADRRRAYAAELTVRAHRRAEFEDLTVPE